MFPVLQMVDTRLEHRRMGEVLQMKNSETNGETLNYVTEAVDRIEDMIDVTLVLTRGRTAVGDPLPVKLADEAQEAWKDIDAPNAAFEFDVELMPKIESK